MNFLLRSAWVPLLVCLALAFAYPYTQDRIEFEGGHPYDCNVYHQMAQQLADGAPLAAAKPFVYRLGMPYLAGRFFPDDVLHGFEVLGLAFGAALGAFLFALLRAYGLSRAMALWLVALFIANPYSPFRFSPYLPALVDSGALALLIGSFWIYKRSGDLDSRSTAVLMLFGCLGALIREIVIVVPLTFLGAHVIGALFMPEKRLFSKQTLLHATVVGATILAIIATRFMVGEAQGSYETLAQMKAAFARNRQFPEIWILCCLTAIGPLVFALFGSATNGAFWRYLRTHVEVPIYLLGMAILSLVAGNHTDRFVFWMLPGCLILLGQALEGAWLKLESARARWLFYAPLLAAQILAYRALVPFPPTDHETLSAPGQASLPLFQNYGEGVNLGQITVAFMTRENRIPLLIEFGILALYLTMVWAIFVGANRATALRSE
ncbi:MAG: hypothetical protein KDB61_02285 [Planctomycetes bacterium]|nr:hypothetical protein [Planctomycetota bacterium]